MIMFFFKLYIIFSILRILFILNIDMIGIQQQLMQSATQLVDKTEKSNLNITSIFKLSCITVFKVLLHYTTKYLLYNDTNILI